MSFIFILMIKTEKFTLIIQKPYQCIEQCQYTTYGIYCTDQYEINEIFTPQNLKFFIQSENLKIPDEIEILSIEIQFYEGKNDVSGVIFHENLIGIGENALNGIQIEFFSLPQKLQILGQNAFKNNKKLTSVQGNQTSIHIIYNGTFQSCIQLKNITGFQNVQKIYKNAFYNCTSLNFIDTNEQLIEIGDYAFQFCNMLQLMDISQIQYIGVRAFEDCFGITSISFPETINRINNQTFYNCRNLTQVVFSKSIEQIDYYAFGRCVSLSCIAIMNENCSIDETAFQNTEFNETYMNYTGEYKRCFEYGYNYCNQTEYDYIVNINDLYTCTTVDNVQYFYKTEIDEEEVNVRVESCEQINYQYQIQGNPIECVQNCPEYLYIQDYLCVDQCSQEYYLQINICVIQCDNQYPYVFNNTNSGMQECVESCELIPDYNIFNEHTTPKQCVNNCTGDYPYIQDNYCESGCTGDYAIPIDYPTNNVCDNNCTFYEVDSVKQCTESCEEQYQFSFTDSTTNRTQCVQDCQNTELQYTQNNICVQQCPEDYTVDENNYCIIQNNNQTGLILGITIPIIIILIVVIIVVIIFCKRENKDKQTQVQNNQQQINENIKENNLNLQNNNVNKEPIVAYNQMI